ncbi:MAG: ThiF family adenylyltransferase [Candidatus Bathyarchaeia archaeon]
MADMGGLSQEDIEAYSRQIVLKDIGFDGQVKLRQAKVGVVGLGGLGGPASIQLAAMGVGYLRLIDRDVVELSNLHRQHLYSYEDTGYPKAEVAAERLRRLNRNLKTEPVAGGLTPDTAVELLSGLDVVVDGLDSIETRYAVNRACIKLKIPYVYGAAIEAFGNITTIVPGETPCLECFLPNFSDENLPTCAIAGVHPSVLGVVASVQASEAVRLIIGEKPTLADYLLYCDLRNMSFDKIHIARHPECSVCSAEVAEAAELPKRRIIQEICGRGGKRTHIITPRKMLDLPLNRLADALAKEKYNLKVVAAQGITFNPTPTISVSILKTGVMVSEGAPDEQTAMKLYRNLILERMQLSPSVLE